MKILSVMVDGRNCLLKVTENTTCGEVIQHLLKLSGLKKSNTDSYFLFASNNITEVRLSKKIQVLKAAEDLASGTNLLNFILRKKIRLRMPDVSAITDRRLTEKSSANELKIETVNPMPYSPVRAPKQIRGVKQLRDLVQVPKRRLIESDDKRKNATYFTKQSTEKSTSFINKSKSDCLNQFPGNFIDRNTNGLLSFCDIVTTKKMDNLPSASYRSSSVDRSNSDDHMTLMTCKFDRRFADHANEALDENLNRIIHAISQSKFNTVEDDAAKDILILEDGPYGEDDDHVRFATMSLSQRVTSTDQRRIRGNVKPVHCTPLANKTMTYLNRSRKRLLTRQFGSSQLPLDKLGNLQLQEIQRRDSYLFRGADGAPSMFICQRKPAFSKQREGCNYFCEHRHVSEFHDNLDNSLLDKELDKAFDSNADVSLNCFNNSASSNVVFGNIQSNVHDHSVLPFDSSLRVMSYVKVGQEDVNDCSSIHTLKMKLVDYSLSDCEISSVASESV
ncbi:hypothetical protein ACJMK2_031121 [Sinanodonta woodiana]|uniref:Ras-associating domain-containing protein n=1 Tax=Sinanodonta woodiana TaxID=1069815 RepID=A0ABD3WZW7_SINWO